MTTFSLRFPEQQLARWASKYDYPGEAALMAGPIAKARAQRYLDMQTFMAIGDWKSPRSRPRRDRNSPEFVEEVTRVALAPGTSPRFAIEALTLLSGVSWPTASVILHFCHPQPYPIIDFRALWSLSSAVPNQYTYAFWEAYTAFTRSLAKRCRTDMRTIDKALWKYSEIHQGAA
jgi:hypothetical protein